MKRLFIQAPLQSAVYGYLISALAIFIFTAAAKLTAPYTIKELNQHDPFLTFLTVKELLVVAISAETAVAVLILLNLKRAPLTGLLAAVWLALIFVAYRLAFAFAPDNLNGVCKCFGGSGSILGKHSDKVAWILLAYLLFVGIPLIFTSIVVNRKKLSKLTVA